ncbi:Hypothetical predicted protein [Cloeon dipterum]|uniref:Uncharacterized protein n=1 Tax=Cloeon dipterum TaxID=197152 RepID=A0A8S1D7W2_9INSE|nr:Hypothetical predicted protein [Cloeon dipterum]
MVVFANIRISREIVNEESHDCLDPHLSCRSLEQNKILKRRHQGISTNIITSPGQIPFQAMISRSSVLDPTLRKIKCCCSGRRTFRILILERTTITMTNQANSLFH